MTGSNCKVYISDDGGATWAESGDLGDGNYARAVVVLDNGDVLVGTDSDAAEAGVAFIYKSTDDGGSWSYLSRLEGDFTDQVGTLLVLSQEE